MLTKQRLSQEARCLVRAARRGVAVPGVRAVDADDGVLALEWVPGPTARELLVHAARASTIPGDLLAAIGAAVARLHAADIVHGDLTTSNVLVRDGLSDVVIIDFGLAHVSTLVEDQAVDLYVLERAIASTHPDEAFVPNHIAVDGPPPKGILYTQIEQAYSTSRGPRQWAAVRRRLDDVRARGRKRSMVG